MSDIRRPQPTTRADVEAQIEDINRRIGECHQLLDALRTERERWQRRADELRFAEMCARGVA